MCRFALPPAVHLKRDTQHHGIDKVYITKRTRQNVNTFLNVSLSASRAPARVHRAIYSAHNQTSITNNNNKGKQKGNE